VGVNSGSIEKELLKKYGYPTPENTRSLIESALTNVAALEKLGFVDIKISIKSSDTLTTIAGYRELSRRIDYPLHIGVTEAGGLIPGTVKSSVALGILLFEGIGDTFRISLTRDPVEEIRVGFELLRCLRIRERGPEMISCPTCGRTRIDLFPMAEEIEKVLQTMKSNLKVAVMGCVVNGPGEAREADIGIAGGHGVGIIFKKGELFKKLPEDELLPAFLKELRKMDEDACRGKE
jgi:(E)-4-hydroxy-3-methylbut-2-enyl-diphosphate synthase